MHDLPDQRERAVVRHVLSRHGEPRRLPHPCRCAQPRRLQGPALQRQAGVAPDLARLRLGQHHRLCDRHRRPRRAARCGAPPRGRLARAGRGGDPRRAGGDRGRRRACGSARATFSSSAPAITRGGWRSAPGATTTRRPARARPGCTSTRCPGCTSGASPPSCPTATARPCRAMSRTCPIRSTPCSSPPWACASPTACSSRSWPQACEEEGRWEFMVVGLPLRLPGATGSPWNPIAIF